MSGLSPARSGAVYSGAVAVRALSSTVPKGTTPRCRKDSISSPGTPARSNGTISALKRPRLSRGNSRVQKGSSQWVYWLRPANPPTMRRWRTAVPSWACIGAHHSARAVHAQTAVQVCACIQCRKKCGEGNMAKKKALKKETPLCSTTGGSRHTMKKPDSGFTLGDQ